MGSGSWSRSGATIRVRAGAGSSTSAAAGPAERTLVALLLDAGDDGQWVTTTLDGAELAAPSLIGFETATTIRRHELADLISHDQAAQAHADLLDLRIEQWPHELIAQRAWELRHNLPVYDAGYVAVAELIAAPLVTLDLRLARAAGTRCEITTPPGRAAL